MLRYTVNGRKLKKDNAIVKFSIGPYPNINDYEPRFLETKTLNQM